MFSILKNAQKEHYAVGAFNASNLEGVRAIIQAAQKMRSPLILATSEGEAGFAGKKQMRAVADAWRQETGLPIILHLDHGKSLKTIKEAIEAGYDSVHFDGSEFSPEENMEKTKEVVVYAKKMGIENIEGELGYLRGKSVLNQTIEIKEGDLTKPEQVLEFIEKTGVDSLAIAIGNIHGIVAGGEERLFLDRLKAIYNQTKDKVCLVLHGGSGLAEDDIKKAIESGIVKININTELRAAYSQTLREFLNTNLDEISPYKIMAPAVEAMQKVVEEKIKLFGSQDKI